MNKHPVFSEVTNRLGIWKAGVEADGASRRRAVKHLNILSTNPNWSSFKIPVVSISLGIALTWFEISSSPQTINIQFIHLARDFWVLHTSSSNSRHFPTTHQTPYDILPQLIDVHHYHANTIIQAV